MIYFCYFSQKNCFLFLTWSTVHADPLFLVLKYKLGLKIAVFRGFTNFFFRTTRLQHKLLILIECPNMNILNLKSTKNQMVAMVHVLGVWVFFRGKIWAKKQIRSNVVKKQRNWKYYI